MHHRSGSWVKGHYRNGTWIAGHNRKSAYVSDYTKHFFNNTSAKSQGIVNISKNNYSSSAKSQGIVNISKSNYSSSAKSQGIVNISKSNYSSSSDLVNVTHFFRLYGIDNNTIGYTVDLDLDDRTDIEKLYETSLSPVNIKKLLFKINERFNHDMPTNIPEFKKQALLRKHWYTVEQLSKEVLEIKIKKAIKQNKSDLIFRIYGIDNKNIGYTVDLDLDDRADIEILYETSLSPVNIKKLLFRIDERFNHDMTTSIPEFKKQALLRKHWHSIEQLSKEVLEIKRSK